MTPDSRVQSAPLAEALVTWSDPSLVGAVREAERRVPSGVMQQFTRWTLDDLSALRRKPMRYRLPPIGRDDVAALDAAWDRLFGAFRLRIERGELTLNGTPELVLGSNGPVRLRSDQAASLKFDPAANAVFVGLTTYLGVTVSRSYGLATDEARRAETAATFEEASLPLGKAILAWVDPLLVQGLQTTPMFHTPLRPQGDPDALIAERPTSLRTKPLRRNSFSSPPSGTPITETSLLWARPHALAAVLGDMRKGIENGELVLWGVQTWPERRTDRETVPALWASDLQFDIGSNQVSIVQFGRVIHRYVAMRVIRTSAEEPAVQLPAVQTRSDGGRRSKAPTATMRGGRPSAIPTIEEALREYLKGSNHGSLLKEQPVWTELARALRRLMQRRQKDQVDSRVPSEDAVRKHLPQIYPRILGETGLGAQSPKKNQMDRAHPRIIQ